ncbi:hypothetical protein K439DRAFT_394340 [Ramaria rubella]|nr:hypothetical protein K439DRAFT_394340 [Ramaria rubella]
MALPDKIADFTVLPLQYDKSIQHALYLREHASKPHKEQATPLPNGRTLFVVNIPPDATERELTLFFKPCGNVERVVIQGDIWAQEAYGPIESEDETEEEEAGGDADAAETESDAASPRRKKSKNAKKTKKATAPPPQVVPLPQPDPPLRTFHHTGSSAHIVFADAVSLPRALAFASSPSAQRTWPPRTGTIAPTGLAHYIALYDAQRPPLPDLKVHTDTFMEVYEYNKTRTKQKSEYRKGEAVVDADGFTLVTRGGAYGTTLGGGVGVASKKFMKEAKEGGRSGIVSGKRGKKKPKKHEKADFYKFQLHEQKRKELVDLKAEFEKDKKKIEKLRESRRFKPY